MSTITVDILNPKAKKILKELADLKLISIQDNRKKSFAAVLKKLRSKSKTAPSPGEITKEVEIVRAKRYAKKN